MEITGKSSKIFLRVRKFLNKVFIHAITHRANSTLDHLLQTISETCLLYIKTATWLEIAAEITPRYYPYS